MQQEGWKRGDPIGYINPDIPDFEVIPYEGERFEAMVPDTFDLAEMAELAVNCITGETDEMADYEMYCGLVMKNPPRATRGFGSVCQMKFLEALPLVRIICGSTANPEVERRWMEVLLHQTGPDGMLYMPVKGRPWVTCDPWGMTEEDIEEVKRTQQLISPAYAGRTTAAMMLYYQRSGDELWKNAALRIVDALTEIAVDKGDYAYFSPNCTLSFKGHDGDIAEANPLVAAETRIITGALLHVYQITGYEKALTLAKKIFNYILGVVGYIGKDGHFQFEEHFHCSTGILQALLEYRMLTAD